MINELEKRMKPGEQILLLGVTGSTAYGLSHADSDIDRGGIYCVPTEVVLGLNFNIQKASHVFTEPDDVQLHEIAKYIKLVLGGNPTVTELLYLESYEYLNPILEDLIKIRSSLLGQTTIHRSYAGYALAQAKRLVNRQENGQKGFNSDLAKRTAKHGRHCFRLMMQAEQLLTTGELTLDVSDHRDELFSMGELAETDPEKFMEAFKWRDARLKLLAQDSVLPETPDYEKATDFLVKFRRGWM